MSQQRQPLRQISVMKMEKLSFEENTRSMTMKTDVFTYMNMLLRQKCTKYSRRIYTLYSDIGIYIDTPLYIFKLMLITSTLQQLMKIVKNPVNLI